MRALCVGLVLLFAEAHAETLKSCPNVNAECRGQPNEACCGANLSGIQVALALTATGSDAKVDTDAVGGDLTCCMYTGSTPPTTAQIDANAAPCVQKRAITVAATGTVTFSAANRFDALSAVPTTLACYQNTDGKRPLVEVLTSAQFTPQNPPEQEGNDLLVVEAEDATVNVANGDTWTAVSPQDVSGTAMQVQPDDGTVDTTTYVSTAPRLDFVLNFSSSGTHYLWVRGASVDNDSDSVHAGLNGAAVATADNIGWFNTSFDWSNLDFSSQRATLNVPSTGQHTVNFWSREDGFILDRFLLTTDAEYVPMGLGPNASPPVSVVVTPTLTPSTSFSASMAVTISTSTAGATIYYTTDGSTPTTSSASYSTAIPITATTTVKAYAVKAGSADSSVATAVYTEVGTANLMARSNLWVVDCDAGSDTNTGAPNSPFKTLGKLQSASKSLGADVVIIGGCSDQTIDIDWASSASDMIEFKAGYWHNSGTELYFYDEGPAPIDPENINSPRIDGSWHPPAYGGGKSCNAATKHAEQSAGNCTASWSTGNPNAVPSVWYTGLIDIESSHVEVAGLRVIGAAWTAINLNAGAGGNQQPYDHVKVRDNVILWAGKMPVLLVDSHHVYFENNRVAYGDACRAQQQFGGSQCYESAALMNYGASVRLGDTYNAYAVATGNVLHDTYGEGMSITLGTKHIVRDNLAYRLISTNFHGNSTGDSIMENNFAFGNPHDGKGFSHANFGKEGYAWAAEFTWAAPLHPAAAGGGNITRNNVYAGSRTCIGIINISNEAANGAHPDQGGEFYHNTCIVDGDYSAQVRDNANGVGTVKFRNNLFSTNSSLGCVHNGAVGATFDHNVWSIGTGAINNLCEGAGDVYNASLSLTVTPANWETYTPDQSSPRVIPGGLAAYRMAAGDGGVNVGVNLTATTHPTLAKSAWAGLMDEIANDTYLSACGSTYSALIGDLDLNCDARDSTPNAGALETLK